MLSPETLVETVNQQNDPVIEDGSKGVVLGAYARRRDLRLTDQLNIKYPDPVRILHREYRQAGARIIQSNTFNGNLYRFQAEGISLDDLDEINTLGAQLAIEEVGDDGWVFGSIGPTGKIILPDSAVNMVVDGGGNITESQAEAAFSRQVAALVRGGIKILNPETFDQPRELLAAIKAIKKIAPSDSAIVATANFSRNTKPSGGRFSNNFGMTPTKLTTIADQYGVLARGGNCGFGVKGPVVGLIRELAEKGGIIVAKFNKGAPRLVCGVNIYPQPDIQSYGLRMYEAGAGIIGLCCGGNPDDIELLANAFANLREV